LPLCAAAIHLAGPARALTIDGYTAAANDRFANNPAFIASDFNLSGISRASNGAWVTMIRPNVYIGCYHYTPATGNTVTFYQTNNPGGPTVTRTISATRQRIGTTDLFVGTLDAPLPENYAYYARATEPLASTANWNQYPYKLASLYHVGISPGAYSGAQDVAVGRNKPDVWQANLAFGNSTTTIFVTSNNTATDTNFVPYETMAQTGDSGAPILYDQGNGTLRLAGIAWVILSSPVGTGFSAVGSYASLISTFESANALPYQPLVPTGFTGERISTTRVDLTWSDNSSIETGYVLERSPDGSAWSALATLSANATAYPDTAAPATGVHYRLRAINGATTGDWVSTSLAAPVPPTTPASFAQSSATTSTVDLTWNAVNGASSLRLERSSLGIYGPWTLVSDAIAGDSITYRDTGLAAGTSYWYRLRASNIFGTSAWSAVAATVTANSSTLVADLFADGGATNGADPLDVAWGTVTQAHAIVADDALDSGSPANVMETSTATTEGDVYAYFTLPAEQTLAIGESLKVSFRLRHTGTPRTDNSRTGFSLAHTPNNNPWAAAGNREYMVRTSYGTTSNVGYVARTADVHLVNSSATDVTLGSSHPAINAGTGAFAVWMDVTRTGESTVVIRYQLGSGTVFEVTDTGAANGSNSGIITTFNRVFFRYRTVAGTTDPKLRFDDVIVTKTIPGTPAPSQHPITAWRTTHFGTSSNSGNAADTFDADGDGLPNLVEYALGGNPTQSGTGILPAIGTNGDRLTLGFTPAETAGLHYIVEKSSDLSDWSDTSDITASLTPGQPFTFTDSADLATTPRRFLRLRVLEAP